MAAARQFSAILRAVDVAATNLLAGCEQAFARDVIDLQPRTVRILKQHRIVARGEAVLAWFMNNFCAEFDEEVIRLINVAALTCAKTVIMQPDRTLTKSLAGIFGSCGMDAKAGTTSNTIEGVCTVSHNRETQERQ